MRSSDPFYPFTITSARYQGTYEDGAYILVAGVTNIRSNTLACGSDIDCMEFWNDVQSEGPIVTLNTETQSINTDVSAEEARTNSDFTRICAMSGSHPSSLFERFQQFRKDTREENVGNRIDEILQEHHELYMDALSEDEVAYTKLWLLTHRQVSGRESTYLKKEFMKRFACFDSLPEKPAESEAVYDEISEFLDENGEEMPAIIF